MTGRAKARHRRTRIQIYASDNTALCFDARLETAGCMKLSHSVIMHHRRSCTPLNGVETRSSLLLLVSAWPGEYGS
jgi:hypothetical protein